MATTASTSGLGLSGLASGVDTSAIVDQLMAIDRKTTTRITYRQSNVTGMQNSLKAIAGKLTALKDAAAALSSDSTWKQTQTAASSDPAHVGVALTGGAGIGGHTIQVSRLASAMQRGYSFAGGQAGQISIAYNSGTPQTLNIDVTATSTVQDVANSINANTSGPVAAAIVKDANGQERLVLSARKTGSASDFTVTANGLLSEDTAYATQDTTKLDALYSLDGAASVPSSTNTIENGIPGVRLTLKGVTAAAATVTVSEPDVDRDGVAAKVKTFVDTYNSLIDMTRGALAEKPVNKPTNSNDAALGSLYGDTGMDSMLNSLRRQMGDIVAGSGINDLADLGISVPAATGSTVSEDGKDGKLVINNDKLKAALNADWTSVKSYFTGFSTSVTDYVKTQTGGSGLIDKRLDSSNRNMKMLQSDLDQMNDRLDAKEVRLKAQFAAMESAMAASQTQQAWLTSQIAALH
jgi:flagellar hook-associated protein 2